MTPLINYDQEQRSLAWYRDRLGVVTGSQVGKIMSKGKAKDKPFSDTAISYFYKLAAERALSPEIIADDDMLQYYLDQTSASTKAMRFGTEQEPEARQAYMELRQVPITEVGFCRHREVPALGSSPDGITYQPVRLGDNDTPLATVCVEFKCPQPETFARYANEIRDGETLKKVNPEYYWQCQANMAVTEAAACDFVAYCPFLKNPIHIARIDRDDDAIKLMLERVRLADEEINQKSQQLCN
ncbi:MAG: YqaJ viral recombinase family protein [Bacteroidales bacterium]|nr:YqaJ viral recombinase family protein [Bacteroidales bacterium]